MIRQPMHILNRMPVRRTVYYFTHADQHWVLYVSNDNVSFMWINPTQED
jgi:hypothetical protein